jgi:hypothetical protein
MLRTTLQILLCSLTLANPLEGQTIRVRILDGRNGHALSGLKRVEFVNVTPKGPQANYATQEGDSYRLEINQATNFRLYSLALETTDWNSYRPCVKRGSSSLLEFDPTQTLTTGVVSSNSCGNTNPVAKPGELVIFVRPTSLWEKFVELMRA